MRHSRRWLLQFHSQIPFYIISSGKRANNLPILVLILILILIRTLSPLRLRSELHSSIVHNHPSKLTHRFILFPCAAPHQNQCLSFEESCSAFLALPDLLRRAPLYVMYSCLFYQLAQIPTVWLKSCLPSTSVGPLNPPSHSSFTPSLLQSLSGSLEKKSYLISDTTSCFQHSAETDALQRSFVQRTLSYPSFRQSFGDNVLRTGLAQKVRGSRVCLKYLSCTMTIITGIRMSFSQRRY